MKRIAFIIFMAASFVGWAQNTLSLSSTSGHLGDTVTLTLSLSNSSAVTAMQAFVPMNEQLTYVSGSATLSNRGNGHSISATVLDDTLRIYVYSLSLASVNGNSGALLTFRLVLGNEPATYNMPLCLALLSSSEGSSLSVQTTAGSITILAPKISLSPNSIDYGHCPIRSSYTRYVTVLNLGNEPLSLSNISFDETTLNCNSGNISISAGGQQTVTVNYLPVTAGAVARHAVFHNNARVGDSILTIFADPFSVNELRPLAVSGYTDSIVTVQLRMNNMDSIVALQTSIKLPEALTYINGSFVVDSIRSQGHIASAGLLGDTLTMLITSMQNRPLKGGDGVVASFKLRLHGYGSYTLRLLQTALSDTLSHNVMSAVYTGSVSIYSPDLSSNNSLDMGSSPVTDTVEAIYTVGNYGNAPLVINQILFTADYFSVAESLPIAIGVYNSATLHVRYCGSQEGNYNALMQIYNNDPRSTLKQVPVTCHRYEPNSLYMSSDAGNSMDDATVSVMLDNYSAITALQMDVEYPHHYASVENNDLQTTSRGSGHIVSAARQNDSTWRVLLLSMQNQPLSGNNGSVLDIRMHILDTNNTNQYPMRLHNVLAAGGNGVNRITSLDSIVYIATRLVIDTLMIHDTTTVTVTDTLIQTEFVHDTTVVTVVDTLIQTEYIYDTIILDADTVIRWIHDTTVVDNYIYDTTYITLHDTTTLVQVDTVMIDNYIHDTTVVVQYDTTVINNYFHDTTYITEYIHDTTDLYHYLHDTTVVVVHDTVLMTETVHDTVIEPMVFYDLSVTTNNPSRGVGVGSGHFPQGTLVEIAGVPTSGNTFQQWSDGNSENPRTVTLTQNIEISAVFVASNPNSIGEEPPSWSIWAEGSCLVIEGLQGDQLRILDLNGRILESHSYAVGTIRFQAPATGSYFVQIGNTPARKIVLKR